VPLWSKKGKRIEMIKIYNLGYSAAINNYLISTEIGYVLIDNGYENIFNHFSNKLIKIHVSPKAIERFRKVLAQA
jgi:flavorubredoxin